MPLPRFRLRTLMITVAVVGMLLTLGVEARRLGRVSWERRLRAELYRLEEERLRSQAARQAALIAVLEAQSASADVGEPARNELIRRVADLRLDLAAMNRQVEHAAALTHTHARLIRRPWVTVPPDPPGPR